MSTPPPGYPAGPASGSPGYGSAGYPPPGYGGYGTPPGYGIPPSHGAPPGDGSPPGYPQPIYHPSLGPSPLVPGAVKPGIIPLRPLTLSDIFNGAVTYIRANPKVTLGLTAAVVIVMQLVTLAATIGPLASYGKLAGEQPAHFTPGMVGTWTASFAVGVLVTWLGGILLSGMLTVIVGRAVFGSPITIAETWAKIRGRLLALVGLSALEAAGVAALVGLVIVIIAVGAAIGSGALAVLVGLPSVLIVLLLMVYLYTVLLFAPVLIVLERLPVTDAITRSFALVRRGFWRVLGIRMLSFVVAAAVAQGVGAPFSIAGQLLSGPAMGTVLLGVTLSSLGSALGQIVTAPFTAGVIVLLYTDRRIRAEAFDLVLQTGAAGGPDAEGSTDNLWLTRPLTG